LQYSIPKARFPASGIARRPDFRLSDYLTF
jgi:hypothetical protein